MHFVRAPPRGVTALCLRLQCCDLLFGLLGAADVVLQLLGMVVVVAEGDVYLSEREWPRGEEALDLLGRVSLTLSDRDIDHRDARADNARFARTHAFRLFDVWVNSCLRCRGHDV